MSSFQSKEQFLKQFEAIVEGIKQTKTRVGNKLDDEKVKRDELSAQLMSLVDLQRKYAMCVKKFTVECQRNAELSARLASV